MKPYCLTAIILLIFAAFVTATAQQDPDFNYLQIRGNTVRTTHAAKYVIKIDKSFTFLGELNHQAVYGDEQFNVSFAVFKSGGRLVMIHAETHTDGSGGLDYSDLAPVRLDGLPFTSRIQCATPEDKEELDSNPQIKFIRSKGFDLSIPFVLHQAFATSKDGTSEVVISVGSAVSKCPSDGPGQASDISELEKVVDVSVQ